LQVATCIACTRTCICVKTTIMRSDPNTCAVNLTLLNVERAVRREEAYRSILRCKLLYAAEEIKRLRSQLARAGQSPGRCMYVYMNLRECDCMVFLWFSSSVCVITCMCAYIQNVGIHTKCRQICARACLHALSPSGCVYGHSYLQTIACLFCTSG
jgi:hypothetical protein